MTVDPELDWVRLAECGANQLHTMRFESAEQNWRQACDIAEGFDEGDPRQATGLNNLAVLARLNEQFPEADRLYREALQAWAGVGHWLEHLQLAPRARSSLFHMRLELSHRRRYARLALDEYYALLPAGSAITLNNHAEWHQCGGDRVNAEFLYETALAERSAALETSECGVGIIRANLAVAKAGADAGRAASQSRPAIWAPVMAEPFTAQAEREGWIIDLPPEFTGEGRLMAALSCACLVVSAGADRNCASYD